MLQSDLNLNRSLKTAHRLLKVNSEFLYDSSSDLFVVVLFCFVSFQLIPVISISSFCVCMRIKFRSDECVADLSRQDYFYYYHSCCNYGLQLRQVMFLIQQFRDFKFSTF